MENVFLFYTQGGTAPRKAVKMLNGIPVSPDFLLVYYSSLQEPLFPLYLSSLVLIQDPLSSFPLTLSAFPSSPSLFLWVIYQPLETLSTREPNSLGTIVGNSKQRTEHPANRDETRYQHQEISPI